MTGKMYHTKYDDYPLDPVPQKYRSKWPDLTIIWAGFILAVSNFVTGSFLGSVLSLRKALVAILHGNILLGVIAILIGLAAQYHGHSVSYTTRYAFGVGGSRILSAIFALAFTGWAAIGIGLAAESMQQLVPFSQDGWSVILTLLFAISAATGFRGMVRVSAIGIPVILILSGFGLHKILMSRGLNMAILFQMETTGAISFGEAMAVVVGSWIVGAVASPDILRFAKRKRDVVISMVITFVFLNSIQMMIGVLLGLAGDAGTMPLALSSLGFGVFGILLLVFTAWTTADNNFYAASLGISNSVQSRKRLLPTLLSVVGAGMLAYWGLYEEFDRFLRLMSLIFAPIGGVIIADFFLAYQGIIDHDLTYPGVRWKGMSSVIGGIVVGYLFGAPMHFLLGMFGAAFFYVMVILLTKKEKTRKMEQ